MLLRSIILTAISLVFLFSCSGGGGTNIPLERPFAAINGTAFDGLIIKGKVSVFEFTNNTRGNMLSSGTTNAVGQFSLPAITR